MAQLSRVGHWLPRQDVKHSSSVGKLLSFPWQPPYTNRSHWPDWMLKKYRWKEALQWKIHVQFQDFGIIKVGKCDQNKQRSCTPADASLSRKRALVGKVDRNTGRTDVTIADQQYCRYKRKDFFLISTHRSPTPQTPCSPPHDSAPAAPQRASSSPHRSDARTKTRP